MDHVGIDVHQKYSEMCGVTLAGKVAWRQRRPTTETGLRRVFGKGAKKRIVVECTSLTPWLVRLLEGWGHEVIVVNPRRVRLIAESTLKTDRTDAEVLARLSLLGVEWLRPIYQRSAAAQELRTRLRVRQMLVRSRTAMINAIRGSLRSQGIRMRSCPTASFVAHWGEVELPETLRASLDPLVETLAELTARIERVEGALNEEARSDELLERLQSVPGVGPVVSLAYVSWVDRPERFPKSREVGPCMGLRPKMRDSAGRERHGPITREGDAEMRRLLVQAAHGLLRTKADCELKRWAQRLAERSDSNTAVVALARKMAVLLHHLWVTGQSFEPFPSKAA